MERGRRAELDVWDKPPIGSYIPGAVSDSIRAIITKDTKQKFQLQCKTMPCNQSISFQPCKSGMGNQW